MMKPIFNTKEAAQFLGYAAGTLANSRLSGTLSGKPAPKFFKIGEKTIRYKRETLEQWAKEHLEPGEFNVSAQG